MILVNILLGCGQLGFENALPSIVHEYSLSGVKAISPELNRGDEPRSFLQESYPLSSTQRLLLRFEKLSDHLSSIDSSEGKLLELKVYLDAESIPEDLKLCPVERNWMMLATWHHAHPFGTSGQWATPGGDYISSECIAPTDETPDPEEVDSDEPSPNADSIRPLVEASAEEWALPVRFDLSQWFKTRARGKGENFGWLLTTNQPIFLFGDKSNLPPKILFNRFPGR